MKEMVSGLTPTLMQNESVTVHKTKLVDYLFANWNHHAVYSTSFFICEFLAQNNKLTVVVVVVFEMLKPNPT